MNDQHLLEAVGATNPYPNHNPVSTIAEREQALDRARNRAGLDDIASASDPGGAARQRQLRGWRLALAVLFGIVAAAAVLVFAVRNQEPIAPDEPTPTPTIDVEPSTTTTAGPAPTPPEDPPAGAQALDLISDFAQQWNVGTFETYLGTFHPDAPISLCTESECASPLTFDLNAWSGPIAHSFGRGTTFLEHECALLEPDLARGAVAQAVSSGALPAGATTVRCKSLLLSYEASITDGVPGTSRLDFAIAGGRIVAFHSDSVLPPHATDAAFDDWLVTNFGTDEMASTKCCHPGEWSLEEHYEAGLRRREYFDLWIAALEAAGCAWDDQTCEP